MRWVGALAPGVSPCAFVSLRGASIKIEAIAMINAGAPIFWDAFTSPSFASNAFFELRNLLIAVILVNTAISVSGRVKIDMVSST
ncbi:hypothetical protein D3C87_2008850 [compost metagenome]